MDMERTRPVRAGDDLREEMETTALARGQLAAWWLTQASWMVKFGNGGFALFDPWWRDLSVDDHWQKLLGEFPLEPEAHPVPDLIACTHWHDDHICPVSIPRLAAAFPATPILIPNRSLDLVTSWGVPEDQLVPMFGDDMATVIGPSSAMKKGNTTEIESISFSAYRMTRQVSCSAVKKCMRQTSAQSS